MSYFSPPDTIVYGNSDWGWDLEKIEEVCGGGSPAKSPAPSWEVCQFSRCAVGGAEDWGGCNQRQQVIYLRMQCIVRNYQLFSWIRVSCCQIKIIVLAFCWMDQWNWKIYVSSKNTRLFTGKKVGNAEIFIEDNYLGSFSHQRKPWLGVILFFCFQLHQMNQQERRSEACSWRSPENQGRQHLWRGIQ